MDANHIIVSGEDALATTIAEELKNAGATVVKLDDTELADTETDLAEAGIADALAVVCAADDDSTNLEIALLARKANPEVRVVARLANDVLCQALSDGNGPGAILNVAELAAPSVVEACLAHATHPFEAAGIRFAVSGSSASRDATLRELYGGLAPVAVIRGANSPNPGAVEVCPGRDLQAHTGDWAVMIGTADEVAARGIEVPRPVRTRSRRPLPHRTLDAARALRNDINPAFYPVVAAVLALTIGSTVVLHLSHQRPRMGWIDALYFTVETITTTGYGDFSFVDQPTWLRLFAAMMMFGGVTTIALLVAFISDVLLSRRFVLAAARPRVGHLRNHIVVVGLSALGIRVVRDLVATGHDVAVVEIDEENRFLSAARELDVPVIFGDATLRQTLESARVDCARAVTVLTHDDIVNIEAGIILAEMLGRRLRPMHHWPGVPLVLQVFDRALGFALAQRFGFVNARSTVELAAPWFIGAAIGLEVLDTFSVGQRSFVIGAMRVAPGSKLDGLRMFDLSTQTRVIAITRPNSRVELNPRRDARLRADDTVYLVGPYRELLDTLRKGQSPTESSADGEDPSDDQ
ncbi:NAD-binding protein [Candidatus Mycobacterium methanotrophicum]|uniref:NAD-binding protein n=1 Tax=Candidatus Mycobacterium methanotrophicum TaxID=2943498 RepID=A0ABY4QGW3_9MYCO|nr:NAD-binding protein [Candidatus Mycobacterium methanotrophicum]UQX09754.1 NAD-binding protein [Candidatus Mycobacterium methanotrophicum]